MSAFSPPSSCPALSAAATSCSSTGQRRSRPCGAQRPLRLDFGDGTGGGPSVVHSYPTAGTYTVTLTVIDRGDNVAAAVQQATVGRSGRPRPPTPPRPSAKPGAHSASSSCPRACVRCCAPGSRASQLQYAGRRHHHRCHLPRGRPAGPTSATARLRRSHRPRHRLGLIKAARTTAASEALAHDGREARAACAT